MKCYIHIWYFVSLTGQHILIHVDAIHLPIRNSWLPVIIPLPSSPILPAYFLCRILFWQHASRTCQSFYNVFEKHKKPGVYISYITWPFQEKWHPTNIKYQFLWFVNSITITANVWPGYLYCWFTSYENSPRMGSSSLDDNGYVFNNQSFNWRPFYLGLFMLTL